MDQPDFYSNWFLIDYHRWLNLGVFYGVSPQKAYSVYLQICALDEHHFSPELREAGRIQKAIADRVLYPSGFPA